MILELIIVLLIVVILVSVGFVQFSSVMEKGRKAEARSGLGLLRQLEVSSYQTTGLYSNLASLGGGLPDGACQPSHYFSYTCNAATGACTATRCSAGGKPPQVALADVYTITLDVDGNFTGTGNRE